MDKCFLFVRRDWRKAREREKGEERRNEENK
jgi:hypothetical protein